MRKTSLLMSLLLLSSVGVLAQLEQKILLSQALEVVEKQEDADYYREIDTTSSSEIVATTYYLDGTVKCTGTYLDKGTTKEHGWFEFFHANGEKESAGSYDEGEKVGAWKRWNEKGEEITTRYYRQKRNELVYKPSSYKGGEKKLKKDLQKALTREIGESSVAFNAVVQVSFNVDMHGNASDFHVIKSNWSLYDNIALQAVSSLKGWQPALRDDFPVSSIYILPVVFELEE